VEIEIELIWQASGSIAQTHDVTKFADGPVVVESVFEISVRAAAVTGTVLVNGYNSTLEPSAWFSNEIYDGHTTIITVTKQ